VIYYDSNGNVITFDEALDLARQRGACSEAMDLIRSLGEDAVLGHDRASEWMYWYAKNVIRGRWLEAEGIICQSAEWATWYAGYVIKGRWLEAEEVIVKDAELADWYACNVIRGRWPDDEEVMS